MTYLWEGTYLRWSKDSNYDNSFKLGQCYRFRHSGLLLLDHDEHEILCRCRPCRLCICVCTPKCSFYSVCAVKFIELSIVFVRFSFSLKQPCCYSFYSFVVIHFTLFSANVGLEMANGEKRKAAMKV
jgi:hypothetical protein